MFFFLVSNLVSLSWAILRGYTPSSADLNSLFSVFRNIIIIVAGLIFGKTLKVPFSKLLIVLSIGPLVSSVVSLIQYFNLFGLGTYAYLMFGKPEDILGGITRVVGIFGNPNYAAFFQIVGFASLICVTELKNPVAKLILWVGICLSVISVLLTFSRTGLIGIVLTFVVFLVLRKKIRVLVFSVIMVMVVVIPNIPAIISNTRYSAISEEDKTLDVTMGGRSDLIWGKKLEKFYSSPIFGTGPAKDDKSNTGFNTTLYDSSFFFLLVTTGAVGFLIMGVFLFFEIKYFYSVRNAFSNQVSIYFLLVNIPVLIFFVTSDLVANPVFSSFFYFSIGTFVSYAERLNSASNIENRVS
ncbi:MAG: O-antigen ligase family protein [Chitinophagaceae bacterium]|nr:O-antigen ligase family protein [Chitinophagaceae bacterium]